LAIVLSGAALASPFFGAVIAGIIIGMTGIQMIFARIQGTRGAQIPTSDEAVYK
jgi:hypothetical protein